MSILDLLQEEVDNTDVNAGEQKKQQELEKDKEVINVLKSDPDSATLINEDYLTEAEKKKSAKVRNKPSPIFDAKSPKVSDDKDHFPIGTINQARNALARCQQYDSVPPWYKGTLKQLHAAVSRAVHAKYPSIDVGGKDKE
jgi:hypothetical protein